MFQPPAPLVGIGWRHPHYTQLLQQRPAVDFLEVHSENFFGVGGAALATLEQARQSYPISLHGVGLSLGSAVGLDVWHLEQLARLVEHVDPVRVSDHASFARGNWRGQTVHGADLLPLPFTQEALDVLCRNVAQVQDRLKRPIAVENLSAYIHWSTPANDASWTETEFLRTLCSRTGCHLLVDVNNIYVNACNVALVNPEHDPMAACRAWLDSIATAPVAEIHLAGHTRVHDAFGDIVIDDHGSPVCDAVWDVYRYALQVLGPVPTLVEWDTDVPPLPILLQQAALAKQAAGALL